MLSRIVFLITDELKHGACHEEPEEKYWDAEAQDDQQTPLRPQSNELVVLRAVRLTAERVERAHPAEDYAEAADVDPHRAQRDRSELRGADVPDEPVAEKAGAPAGLGNDIRESGSGDGGAHMTVVCCVPARSIVLMAVGHATFHMFFSSACQLPVSSAPSTCCCFGCRCCKGLGAYTLSTERGVWEDATQRGESSADSSAS